MKAIMMGGGALACTGALYWHGDLSGGQLYNVPVAQAYQTLSGMPVDSRIAGVETAITGGTISSDSYPADSAIKWHIRHDGDDIGTLVATLRSAGASRTRITVSFENGTTDESKGRVKDARALVRSAIRPLMAEQIDARMNHRDLDPAAIKNAMTGFVVAHTDAVMREASSRMDEAAATFRQMDAENERYERDRAYREAQDSAGKPTASTRPMVDTSRFNR